MAIVSFNNRIECPSRKSRQEVKLTMIHQNICEVKALAMESSLEHLIEFPSENGRQLLMELK